MFALLVDVTVSPPMFSSAKRLVDDVFLLVECEDVLIYLTLKRQKLP